MLSVKLRFYYVSFKPLFSISYHFYEKEMISGLIAVVRDWFRGENLAQSCPYAPIRILKIIFAFANFCEYVDIAGIRHPNRGFHF